MIQNNLRGIPGLSIAFELLDETQEQHLWKCCPWDDFQKAVPATAGGTAGLLLGSAELHHPALFGQSLHQILQTARRVGLDSGSVVPDFCCMLTYPPGRGVGSHIDSCTKWGLSVLVFCFGRSCTLRMTSPTASNGTCRTVDIELPRRCAYELTGEARYQWTHAILPNLDSSTVATTVAWNPLGLRRSIVFRTTSAYEHAMMVKLECSALQVERARTSVVKFCRQHQLTVQQHTRLEFSALRLAEDSSENTITDHINTALIASENGDPRHSASQLLQPQVVIVALVNTSCSSYAAIRQHTMLRSKKPNLCISRIEFQQSGSSGSGSGGSLCPLFEALSDFFACHACISGSRYQFDNAYHEPFLKHAGLVANHELSQLVVGITHLLVEEGLYSFPQSEILGIPGCVMLSRHAEKQCITLLLSVLLALFPVPPSISRVQHMRVLAQQVIPSVVLIQSKPPCSDCVAWLTGLSRFLKLPTGFRVASDGGNEWKSNARFRIRECRGKLYTQQYACVDCSVVNHGAVGESSGGVLPVCICDCP